MVDDEVGIRDLVSRILEREGYDVSLASDGREGIDKLGNDTFDLILLDIQMPLINGFDFISAVREKDKDIPVVVMTGFGTVENAVKALKSGASDFIVKPFDIQNFLQTVKNNLEVGKPSGEISKLKMVEAILELNRIIVSLTNLDSLIEKVVAIIHNIFQPESAAVYFKEDGNFILRKRFPRDGRGKKLPVSYEHGEMQDIFANRKSRITGTETETVIIPLFGKEKEIGFISIIFPENKKIKEEEIKFLEVFATQVGIGVENATLFEVVKNSYLNSIRSLVNSLETRDTYTKGHSEQVAYYSVVIGKQLGFSGRDIEILRNASYLHDLGKVGIRDVVLLKPGPLNEEEMSIIKQHPEMTVRILEPLGLREGEIDACLYHHERIDGKGYPKGLKGEDIPIFAKILAVADAYSAMTSERPYRKRMMKEEAVSELKRWAGIQFDSGIVNIFVKLLEEKGTKAEKGEEHG